MEIFRRKEPISTTAWWTWLVIGGIAAVSAALVVYGQTTISRDELCYSIEGPPPQVREIENPQYDTQFGLFPLGLGCTWELPDGNYEFVGNSNTIPTALFYGGLLLGGISVAQLLAKRDRR